MTRPTAPTTPTTQHQPEVDPLASTDDTGDTDDPASTAAAGGTGHPERPLDGGPGTSKIEVGEGVDLAEECSISNLENLTGKIWKYSPW